MQRPNEHTRLSPAEVRECLKDSEEIGVRATCLKWNIGERTLRRYQAMVKGREKPNGILRAAAREALGDDPPDPADVDDEGAAGVFADAHEAPKKRTSIEQQFDDFLRTLSKALYLEKDREPLLYETDEQIALARRKFMSEALYRMDLLIKACGPKDLRAVSEAMRIVGQLHLETVDVLGNHQVMMAAYASTQSTGTDPEISWSPPEVGEDEAAARATRQKAPLIQ